MSDRRGEAKPGRAGLLGDPVNRLGFGGLALLLVLGAIIAPLPTLVLVIAGLALLLLLHWWPTSGLIVLLAATHFTRFDAEIGPVNVRAEQAALVLVAGVLFVQVLAQRRPIWLDLPGLCALAWFGVNALATVINAPDPGDSVRHIIRLGMMAVTYVVAVNLLRTRKQWWTLFWVFLGLALAQALFGLLARVIYSFGVNIGVQTSNVLPIPVPYGTLEEGNMFGSQSAAWLLAFLCLLMVQPRPFIWKRAALLAAIGVTGLATALSFSRGAWLALGIGLAVWFVTYRASRRIQIERGGLLLLGLPLVLIVSLILSQVLPTSMPLVARLRSLFAAFTSALNDQTFGNRLADIVQAVSDWQQHPLIGWGPGTFFQLYGQRWGSDAWIANQLARTLQETGLLGLLAFGGFVGGVLWIGWRAIGRLDNRLSRAALLGLWLGFITLMVAYQSTDGTWLAYMWVHAALLVSGARLLREQIAPGDALCRR